MDIVKTPNSSVNSQIPVKKTRAPKCYVKKTCPKGYSRKELATIATECGIDLKRGPNHKNPRTLKNVEELCTEILALIREFPGISLEEFIEKANEIIQEVNNITDNEILTSTYRRIFDDRPQSVIRSIEKLISQTDTEPLEVLDDNLEKIANEFRDNLNMTVEIISLKGKVDRLLEKEISTFGVQGPIMLVLEALSEKISRIHRNNLEELSTYNKEYNDIAESVKRLGRRCVNPRSPVEDEDVNEIPEQDWIRLSNGACWDIDTLIKYIKTTTNGQNTIKKIKEYMPSYPSDLYIWITDDDYKKIVKHPKAKAAQLGKFIKDREYAQYANRISDSTMDMLYNMGSLLWSRGPPFVTSINENLTPQQLARWNEVSRRSTRWDLPDEIFNARPGTIEQEIQFMINGAIKSRAISQLRNYYDNLNANEKEALEIITPGLGLDIIQCNAGAYCVMQMGEKLIDTYNKMAYSKGRTRVNWKHI